MNDNAESAVERYDRWAAWNPMQVESVFADAIAELKAELQLFHDFLGTPITGHFDEKSISGRFKEMVALEVECYSIAYDANKRQIAELKARIEELTRRHNGEQKAKAKAERNLEAYQKRAHYAEMKLTDHSPEGHNVTNAQFMAEKQRADEAEAKLAAAEEEVERLQLFCYDCEHLDGWGWCRESGLKEQRGHRDHPCLFSPSRYRARLANRKKEST